MLLHSWCVDTNGNIYGTKHCRLAVQEPTGAATISDMEAIVVSKETVKGAAEINTWRQQHGSVPLTVVTVDLVGNQGSDTASKLSSTRLRIEEANKSSRQVH